MPVTNHSLANELPEFKTQIHNLKMTDNHFSRLHDEYGEVDHEIHRIESGVENTSDEYLEELKKKRLFLKDSLYEMLKKEAGGAA
ncbi:YdcH family protein [Alteromonas sp. a30]|uniref:YdcH family protein n=1 Tax=Alteromonas sp. a30 TaxID=2730917 RepID=UPI00228003ED|nr:YdcH family protein [Alteromonas sp. a30]MCY7295550.1 YdcH family protein [Alteromonas sp. a30]